MNTPTDSLRAPRRSRQGMTLIEVIVGAVILGILSIMASTAFYYPRLLVVNSGLEQSAIHAGIAEIERNLYATNSVSLGTFNTDGWDITVSPNPPTLRTETIPGTSGDTCKYLVISNSISFRDGEPPVEFITYRSLEVPSNQR